MIMDRCISFTRLITATHLVDHHITDVGYDTKVIVLPSVFKVIIQNNRAV